MPASHSIHHLLEGPPAHIPADPAVRSMADPSAHSVADPTAGVSFLVVPKKTS
ncbi:hypothetical protein BDD12DRAFT_851554 [Trichophaea hybrida]|nr:hypothetical protein BDD12DRAFT_851554 [Trichophaea hybrida]